MPVTLLLLSRTLMVGAVSEEPVEQIASVLKELPDAMEEILVDSLGEDDPEMEKKVTDRAARMIKEERMLNEKKKDVEEGKAPTSESDQTDMESQKKEENDKEKQKLVNYMKIATDDSAVNVEKELLTKMKHQVEKAEAKIKVADSYLEEWRALLGKAEELSGSTKLSKDEVFAVWKSKGLGDGFDYAFTVWDSDVDGALSAKRTKMLIEDSLQQQEETLVKKPALGKVIATAESTEDDEQMEEMKKTADKVSNKLKKMFSKIEQDISKSDKKIGASLKSLPMEECTIENIKGIIEKEYEGDSTLRREVLEEVLKGFGPDDTPEEIKAKIEREVAKWNLDEHEEDKEELDVSDVEEEQPVDEGKKN